MNGAISMVPRATEALAEAAVALQRLERFLLYPEPAALHASKGGGGSGAFPPPAASSGLALRLVRASFRWPDPSGKTFAAADPTGLALQVWSELR